MKKKKAFQAPRQSGGSAIETGQRLHGYFPLFIFIGSLLLFLPAITFPFFPIDDPVYVKENLMVRSGFTGESVAWALSTFYYGNWCPVTWLSLMLDFSIYGLWPGGFHLTNIVLHSAACVCLYLSLLSLTGDRIKSFCVSLLFAAHPICVESVVWISSRKDVLSSLFFFLTILLYTRYVKTPRPGTYLSFHISFVLGLMSKSVLITMPAVLLVLDFWPLRRNLRKNFLALVMEKCFLCAFTLLFLWMTLNAQGDEGALSNFGRVDISIRLLNLAPRFWAYVGNIFWPSNLHFPYPFVDTLLPHAWGALLALILTALILVLVIKKHPYLGVGFCIFGAVLAPYLQFVQVGLQSMADRWASIPSVGLFIAFIWGMSALLSHWGVAGKVQGLCFVPVLLACIGFTVRLETRWSDDYSMLTHSAGSSNFMAHEYLSAIYRRERAYPEALQASLAAYSLNPRAFVFSGIVDLLDREGRIEEAISIVRPSRGTDRVFAQSERAATLLTVGADPKLRSLYEAQTGKSALDEASDILSAVIKERSDDFMSFFRKAQVEHKRKKYAEAKEAYLHTLSLNPSYVPAYNHLAVLYNDIGDLKSAEETTLQSLSINPNNIDSWMNLSDILVKTGKTSRAAGAVKKALFLNPENAKAHAALGDLKLMSGDVRSAADAYAKALELDDRNSKALNGKGSVLFAQRKYQDAEDLFRLASEVSPESAIIRFNYGALLLKLGKRDLAAENLAAAEAHDPSLAAEIKSLLRKPITN